MGIIISVIAGMLVGILGNILGGKYYEKRFDKKWDKLKNYILALVFSGIGAGLFWVYGYAITTIIGYEILVSALLVIGQIDKKEMIIPNAILLVLLAIRIILLATEMIMNQDVAVYILISAIMGVIYGGVIFLIARLFGKDGIGMGDIKLFAIIGFYVGNTVILPVMLASLFIAMVSGVIMVARKKLTMKESISFGPYITVGSLLVMFMGV